MSELSDTTYTTSNRYDELINVNVNEYTTTTILHDDYYDIITYYYPIVFDIQEIELEFLKFKIIHSKIYLGCYTYCKNYSTPSIVYGCIVSPDTFLLYNGTIIGLYLTENDTTSIRNEVSNIDLMKLYIDPNTDNIMVIVKTFWIRIIQRTWKKIYKEQMYKNALRRTTKSLRQFELTGKPIESSRNIYGLLGMLAFLK